MVGNHARQDINTEHISVLNTHTSYKAACRASLTFSDGTRQTPLSPHLLLESAGEAGRAAGCCCCRCCSCCASAASPSFDTSSPQSLQHKTSTNAHDHAASCDNLCACNDCVDGLFLCCTKPQPVIGPSGWQPCKTRYQYCTYTPLKKQHPKPKSVHGEPFFRRHQEYSHAMTQLSTTGASFHASLPFSDGAQQTP